jgi:hypothetical protein
MIVRRLLAGVLLVGLAASTLAAAPREDRRPKTNAPPAPPAGMGTRVFARADALGPLAQTLSSPSPSSAAPSSAPASSVPPSSAPAPGAPPSGTPASEPGTTAGLSPEIALRARAEFDAHRAGKIDRSRYTPEMNGIITDALLVRASSELQSLGTVKTFSQVRRITHGATSIYVFRIECENAPVVEETIAWNAAGKVDYLSFGPVR